MKKLLIIALIAAFILPPAGAYSAERAQLTIENAQLVNIAEPLEAVITAGDGFCGAVFRLEGEILYTLETEGGGEYEVSLDLSGVTVLGEAVLTAEAAFDTTELLSVTLNLVKLEDKRSVFNEDFSKYVSGTTAGNFSGVLNAGAEMSADTYDGNNTALKMEVFKKVVSGAPFLTKNGIGLASGSLVSLTFDVFFGSLSEYLFLEPRNVNGKYPSNNGTAMSSVRLFDSNGKLLGGNSYSPQTWYTARVDINTITGGLEFYIKGGEYEEFQLQQSYPGFTSDGFGEARLTFYSGSETGGYILFDNIGLTNRPMQKLWYARTHYENAEGNALSPENMAVSGGRIKLRFSEDMGDMGEEDIKIFNSSDDEIEYTGEYDSTSFEYTMSPKNPMRYNGRYFIRFSDSLLSAAENAGLSDNDIKFRTEKYAVGIDSYTEDSNSVQITLRNPAALEENMVLAVCCYSNGALADVNFVLPDSEKAVYNVAITKPQDKSEIKIYLLENLSSMLVKEVCPDA